MGGQQHDPASTDTVIRTNQRLLIVLRWTADRSSRPGELFETSRRVPQFTRSRSDRIRTPRRTSDPRVSQIGFRQTYLASTKPTTLATKRRRANAHQSTSFTRRHRVRQSAQHQGRLSVAHQRADKTSTRPSTRSQPRSRPSRPRSRENCAGVNRRPATPSGPRSGIRRNPKSGWLRLFACPRSVSRDHTELHDRTGTNTIT